MGYILHAVLAHKAGILEESPFREWPKAELNSEIDLLPLTSDLKNSHDDQDVLWDGEADLPLPFLKAIMNDRTEAKIAVISVDYFGGTGFQTAILFQGGRVLWRKEKTGAINEALRSLGVSVTPGMRDEFDSVNLGRHRHTDKWL